MGCFLRISFLCLFFALFAKGGSSCRVLWFLDCVQDKSLKGHVIKTIPVPAPGLKECQHQCFLEKRCVSYILGPKEGMSRSCNLSDTDHLEDPDDVESELGAEYCPIKNPCESKPCPNDQACRPDFELNTYRCRKRATGPNTTCTDLKRKGINQSGVYNITPITGFNVQVYCDQETNGGGWTVIQKRLDGSVDFYRGWDDYKRGFGNKNGEYWLGLDAIHILTNSGQNELRVELEDLEGNRAHALYGLFKVGPESEDYILNVANFKGGDAGDSLKFHNGRRFSTYDRDHDEDTIKNCAALYRGSWWYFRCHHSNLNGQYLNGSHRSYATGINWLTWKGFFYSAKEAEMKIRKTDFNN